VSTTLRDRARRKIDEILRTHEVPSLPPAVVEAMREVIEARRRAIET
jgi:trimethylamine:corrinoid methyltransferase-like protein